MNKDEIEIRGYGFVLLLTPTKATMFIPNNSVPSSNELNSGIKKSFVEIKGREAIEKNYCFKENNEVGTSVGYKLTLKEKLQLLSLLNPGFDLYTQLRKWLIHG